MIRCTVPAPQHKVRAVQQTPTPSLREPRTAVSKAEPTFGRPISFPCALAGALTGREQERPSRHVRTRRDQAESTGAKRRLTCVCSGAPNGGRAGSLLGRIRAARTPNSIDIGGPNILHCHIVMGVRISPDGMLVAKLNSLVRGPCQISLKVWVTGCAAPIASCRPGRGGQLLFSCFPRRVACEQRFLEKR